MNSPEESLTIALGHHQAGELDAAEKIYRQILSLQPENTKVLYLSGLIALDRQDRMRALSLFQKAVECEPQEAQYHTYLGVALAANERYDSAIESYLRSLQLRPACAITQKFLGDAYVARSEPQLACQAYQQAIRIHPNFVDAYCSLGSLLRQHRQFTGALECFQHALRLEPNRSELHFSVGRTYFDEGRYGESIVHFQRATAINPSLAAAYLNIGAAYEHMGEPQAAIQAYEEAVRITPDLADAYYGIGNCLNLLHERGKAIHAYEKAIQLRPQFADALCNLGGVYQELGDEDKALHYYQQSLFVSPDSPNALCNLGNLMVAKGKFNVASEYYRRALKLAPDHCEVLFHFANAQIAMKELEVGVTTFERLIQLAPKNAQAYFRLGCAYKEQFHHDLALKMFQRAHELEPKHGEYLAAVISQLQSLCQWEGIDELSQQLLAWLQESDPQDGSDPVSPFVVISLATPSTAEQQQRAAIKFVRAREEKAPTPMHRRSPDQVASSTPSKINIGYLSGDLQRHPVGYLVGELFESHDRNRFNVFGYSFSPEEDSAIRKRLTRSFDHFRDIFTASYREAAERIAADNIDILIDLQGHTARSRTEILLHRPAPIQVNYLGYPGTMGTRAIDYILVDEQIVPREHQPYFTERLVYLPGSFMVSDSQRKIDPAIPLRHLLGLPEDGFVFCAFNSNHKITKAMFDIWMRLLKQIPRSVLWLRDSNRFAVANLQRYAREQGVEENRLIMASSLPMSKHLARHRAADLFLDTFPYNQHSTAADALRMGLPMVTLFGETFPSRVAGSLLRTLGLPELIAHDFEEYEAIALKMARDHEWNKSIRRRLGTNLKESKLFDGRAFAKNVEQAYETMIDFYRQGLAPQPFSVPDVSA